VPGPLSSALVTIRVSFCGGCVWGVSVAVEDELGLQPLKIKNKEIARKNLLLRLLINFSKKMG
jgi:hypothetical protein